MKVIIFLIIALALLIPSEAVLGQSHNSSGDGMLDHGLYCNYVETYDYGIYSVHYFDYPHWDWNIYLPEPGYFGSVINDPKYILLMIFRNAPDGHLVGSEKCWVGRSPTKP